MDVRALKWLKHCLRPGHSHTTRATLEAAFHEVVGEVAFVWAHFQLVSRPENALEDQILGFGLVGTLVGIQDMLKDICWLRDLERWDVLFAGIIHAQTYCDRYSDEEVREAIAKTKLHLCPPPHTWRNSRFASTLARLELTMQ